MRLFGSLLIILGILALIAGIGISVFVGLEIKPFVDSAYQSKAEIEGQVDSIGDVLDDVEIVRQQAMALIEDYKKGEIRNPDDHRITSFFRQVEDLSYRSSDIKEKVAEELKAVEKIASELENRGQGIITLGALGVLLMVLSGWLVVFGLLCRKNKN